MPRPSKKSSTRSGSQDDPAEAGLWMYRTLASYGVDAAFLTKAMAFGMLRRLKAGLTPEKAAEEMGLKGWERVWPSEKQTGFMEKLGLPWRRAICKRQAGLMLDAHLEPLKLYKALVRQIDRAKTAGELDEVGRDVRLILDVLPEDFRPPLLEAGQEKRKELGPGGVPE